MILSKLIERETQIVLKEIKDKVEFVRGCKFFVFHCNNQKEFDTLRDNLRELGFSNETYNGRNYSVINCYIWLRWEKIKYATFFPYTEDGKTGYNNFNVRSFEASDLFSIELKPKK